MRIKRFNESLDNNQIKEWIEDLLIPLVDCGFKYNISENKSGYNINFNGIGVPNITNGDFGIFNKLADFYSEMEGILNDLNKQFDITISTSGIYFEIYLHKRSGINLPEFFELSGDTILVDFKKMKEYFSYYFTIISIYLVGDELVIRHYNNYGDENQVMLDELKPYSNIFNMDYGDDRFYIKVKDGKYKFEII